MMDRVISIEPSQLERLLTDVGNEERRGLVLLGPDSYFDSRGNWPADYGDLPVYQLRSPVEGVAELLTDLVKLEVLCLPGNQIGDVGAEAISRELTQLRSLDLAGNQIGDVGAHAIARHLPQLNSLRLGNNRIEAGGVQAIAQHLSMLTTLDLTSNRIGTEGAQMIARYPSKLASLDLTGNQIGDKGAQMIARHMHQLTSLYLWDNRISDAGARAIARNLQGLTLLHLGDNEIETAGAAAIARALIQLNSLYLWDNLIGDAGALAIGRHLSKLTSLYLGNCQIGDAGAKMIARNLTRLRALYLGGNQIGDSGAETIAQNLTQLIWLDLEGNDISSIEAFSKLSNLRSLDLSNTNVSDLSPLRERISLGIQVSLDSYNDDRDGICANDCPLIHPPPEVIEQGREAILNYFLEIDEQGIDHLYEAKVLIVGGGGAGKTSLLRRLYLPGQPLPTEDETTRGIEIHRHEFETSGGRTFRLNVWDFGGQQIYHATHQFFLTKNSLYILLDDTRKNDKSAQDEGFKYWLEVVETLSAHSPVLIFQNEKGGRSKQIDEAGIKRRFTDVKDTYRGNLEEPFSAEGLHQAIEFYVQKLPHIGEEVPAKWPRIRDAIEARAETDPYISQQDYFTIYGEHLEFDRARALHLSRYFHDLGVFLHFQDEPLLSKTIVLQNHWATEAVFKILDDEIIKSRAGRFNSADCRRLWEDGEYADMHAELLAMMEKFELCYQLPNFHPPTWLAPQLLPPSRPDQANDWAKPTDLVLAYRYEFLPKGLVSRLMVRQHRFVKQPDLAWTTGAIFEHEGSLLLAEETATGNEIVLRARGPEKKGLLSVIANELDTLNDSFRGLKDKVARWVPCICTECAEAASPQLFDQPQLLRRKRRVRLEIECPISFETVSVLELLDGLELDKLPKWATKPADAAREEPTAERAPKTVKIFLASSAELCGDRDEFELYFRQQNDLLRKKGLYLEIERWENFLDAMSATRLQDEYNKEVRSCDIFVSLFMTKTGKYTEEEFDTAHRTFKESGKPLIYTFFKKATVSTDSNNLAADIASLDAFKDKLNSLGHFHTSYDGIEHLKRQFRDQLAKLDDKGLL